MDQNKSQQPDYRIQQHTYFLNQGQGIRHLQNLLDGSFLSYHFRKYTSIVIEIIMYFCILIIIIAAIGIPSHLVMAIFKDGSTTANLSIENEDLTAMIYILKFIIFLLMLPFIGFIFLLRRNRKKSNTIYQSCLVAKQMQSEFDAAKHWYGY